MNILYGCNNCTQEKYKKLNTATVQPAQKYHRLLMCGLQENGAKVVCYSGLPINRRVTKKIFICEKDEMEQGVYYHYYKTINFPLFRQAMIFSGASKAVKKCKKDEKTVILCDCLNRANVAGMLKGNKRKKFPLIMIVTDLPDFLFDSKVAQAYNKLLSKADGYIFLTEQMSNKINVQNKPYVVLEGHCDYQLQDIGCTEKYEARTGKKVIVYAGSIKKLYGIENLVKGFTKANIEDAELQIFGDGDYKEELQNICETNKNVKYMGVCPNEEIVAVEQRASLLVNPRPTAPEYTKYSFPSKNMEYMVSGTPVLTTKLSGMPIDYYPYVYTIDDETVNGVANAIKNVFSFSFEERTQTGKRAREFVLQNKSNIIQARKIIQFLEENF